AEWNKNNDWSDFDDCAGRTGIDEGGQAMCGDVVGCVVIEPAGESSSLGGMRGPAVYCSSTSSSMGGAGGSTRADSGNGGRAGRSRSTSKYGQPVACPERPGVLAAGATGVGELSSSSSQTDEIGTTR